MIDSLAAVPVLRDARLDGFIDLGSGGGFPGLPLAAALPDVSALLVDSVAKKVRFVDAAIGATGLAARVSADAVRAESLAQRPRHRERWPAVTARAVASLADIVELSFPLLRIGGRVIAWKTVAAEGEMAAASRAVDALGGGRVRVIDVRASGLEGHRLVVVTKAGRTSASYPRDPAERRRRPW